jgi:hypothetical protein
MNPLTIKSWELTTTKDCRWAEYIEPHFRDWAIIWEDSCDDYQGSVAILGFRSGQFRYCEYSYGSCSGCDEFDNLGNMARAEEFQRLCTTFTPETFIAFLKSVRDIHPDYEYEELPRCKEFIFSITDDPQKLTTKLQTILTFK